MFSYLGEVQNTLRYLNNNLKKMDTLFFTLLECSVIVCSKVFDQKLSSNEIIDMFCGQPCIFHLSVCIWDFP
jgi:hypothetical protein